MNTPKPYSISLKLYTGSGDGIEDRGIKEYKQQLCSPEFGGNDYQSLAFQACHIFEWNEEEFNHMMGVNESGDGELEHCLIYLPTNPEMPIFWKRVRALSADALSDGHVIGFGTPDSSETDHIHKLYASDASMGGHLPTHRCGPVFRHLLGDTPHINNDGTRDLDPHENKTCYLSLPLPLLWGLAAVQTKVEYWETVLPDIIRTGTISEQLSSESCVTPGEREEFRVVAFRMIRGLDCYKIVTIPYP